MKIKLLMVVALCVMMRASHAQTTKKSSFSGGGLSFGTSDNTSNKAKINSLSIVPKAGYFITNQFALGVELAYNLSNLNGEFYEYYDTETNSYQSTFGFKEENFGISPFTRYYIPVKSNFMFFAQANFTAQIHSTKEIDDSGYLIRTNYRFKGFGTSLNSGFAFFPHKKLALEFSFPLLSYFNERNKSDINAKWRNSKNLNLVLDNFTPFFGINFHINRL